MNRRIVLPAAVRDSVGEAEESRSTKEEQANVQDLVSIIIPCIGQLEYTRLCVSSVFRNSRTPFELIFLVSDSLDGTEDYLAGVQAAAPVRVEVFKVFEESHLPALLDDGVKKSAGEFVILLDNDSIVSERWIEQLTALAVSRLNIGIVGPMSNHASVPQLIPSVPNWAPIQTTYIRFENGSGSTQTVGIEQNVNAFANEWRAQHQGKWLESSQLDTFCLLFKHKVLQELGPLSSLARRTADHLDDGRLLDKKALGEKALLLGYELACCADLFVYHAGTKEPIYFELQSGTHLTDPNPASSLSKVYASVKPNQIYGR